MYAHDSKIKRYLTVITPSGIGAVLYITLAGLLMVAYQFQSIQDYLGLPRNIEFGATVKGWLEVLLNSSLGQGRTEVFVVGLFWAFVGLAVYIFLRGLSKVMYDLGESIEERGYVWPRGTDRLRPFVRVVERTVFQVVIFFALVYWVLQPLARVLDGPVYVDLIGTSLLLQYIGWFIAIVLTLHIAVVLTRLLLLKPRLFG